MDAAGQSSGRAPPPNVVLIMADDMGAGDAPCVPGGHPLVRCGAPSFGHPYAEMPALLQLGAEGTRFMQAYTMGRTCAPSRAALMTGRLPNRLPPPGGRKGFGEHPSVSELLTQHGYMAGHFGKWNIGRTPRPEDMAPAGTYSFSTVNLQGWPPGTREVVERRMRHSDDCTWWGRDTEPFEYAIGWLEHVAKPPFYMHVWGKTPHRPVPRKPFQSWMPYSKLFNATLTRLRARLESARASDFGPHTRPHHVLANLEAQNGRRLSSASRLKRLSPDRAARIRRRCANRTAPERGLADFDRKIHDIDVDCMDDELNIQSLDVFKKGMTDYLGELWAFDYQIGRMLRAIDDAGVALRAPHPARVHFR